MTVAELSVKLREIEDRDKPVMLIIHSVEGISEYNVNNLTEYEDSVCIEIHT